jgi:hypothetical protein
LAEILGVLDRRERDALNRILGKLVLHTVNLPV